MKGQQGGGEDRAAGMTSVSARRAPVFQPLSCDIHSDSKPGLAQSWRGHGMGTPLKSPKHYVQGDSKG